MKARDIGLTAAAAALVLDQSTKLLMLYGLGLVHMGPSEAVPVLPFFNLVMVWNPGISYGLFPASGPEGTAFLATFQLLAAGALSWWLWFAQSRRLGVALGLVIGFFPPRGLPHGQLLRRYQSKYLARLAHCNPLRWHRFPP